MKQNPWLTDVLSLVFPGLCQIYVGKRALGAAFMLAFIVIGNLNAIWLSIYAGAQTDLSFFSHTFPRLLSRCLCLLRHRFLDLAGFRCISLS